MSKIKAVLLVPERDDPHGLLREGPCGARPPMAYQETGTGIWRPYRGPLGEAHPENNDALVLAWDGEPVVEGWRRILFGRMFDERLRPLLWSATVEHIRILALERMRFWENSGMTLGTLVLLDAEGRKVSD